MVTQLNTFSRTCGNYDLMATLFVTLLLIFNVAAIRLVAFGPEWSSFGLSVLPIIADDGALLFPLIYVSDDAPAEVFGMWEAQRATLLGFGILLLVLLIFPIVGAVPAVPGYKNQKAFIATLGFAPRTAVASLAGYLVGQFLNTQVLVKLEQWREGEGMWKRPLGSTVVGEAADTIIFRLIAFSERTDGDTMLNYIVVGYLFKAGVEAVLPSVTYQAINLVRSREPEPTKARGTTSAQALELPELLIPDTQMFDSIRPNPFQRLPDPVLTLSGLLL